MTLPESNEKSLSVRSLRQGFSLVLIGVLLGITLEALHGFKVSWLVDPGADTRRLMWRLAHAHATLLGFLNILYGLLGLQLATSVRRIAWQSLTIASVLIPIGFFLGGLWVYGGDPGLGIVLVPMGAIALVVALFITVRSISDQRTDS